MPETGRSINENIDRIGKFTITAGVNPTDKLSPIAQETFLGSPVRKTLYRQIRTFDAAAGSTGRAVPEEQLLPFYRSLDEFISQDSSHRRIFEYLPIYLFPLDPQQLNPNTLKTMSSEDIGVLRKLHEAGIESMFEMKHQALPVGNSGRVYQQMMDRLHERGAISDREWQELSVVAKKLPSSSPKKSPFDRVTKLFKKTAAPRAVAVETLLSKTQLEQGLEDNEQKIEESGLYLARSIFQSEDFEILASRMKIMIDIVKEISRDYPAVLPAFVLNGSGSKGYWEHHEELGKGSDLDIILIVRNNISFENYKKAVSDLQQKAVGQGIIVDSLSLWSLIVPVDLNATTAEVDFDKLISSEPDQDLPVMSPYGFSKAAAKFATGEIFVDSNDLETTETLINLKGGLANYLKLSNPEIKARFCTEEINEVLGRSLTSFKRRYKSEDKKTIINDKYRAIASLLFIEKVGF